LESVSSNKIHKKKELFVTLNYQTDCFVEGLGLVASRTGLKFAQMFLRRSWRTGTDLDMCSELLTEALDSFRSLVPTSVLNPEESESWVQATTKSMDFCRNIVLLKGCQGALTAHRYLALNIILEISLVAGE